MSSPLSDSRLANVAAQFICDAFDEFHAEFRSVSRRARLHFERRDWRSMQTDAAGRLELYAAVISGVVARIRDLLGPKEDDKLVWASMKAVYSGLIAPRDDWELAETFFNSVTRRIFTTVGVDRQIEFVDSDFDAPPTKPILPFYRTYKSPRSVWSLVEDIINDYSFSAPYEDRDRDVNLAGDAILEYLLNLDVQGRIDRVEVLRPLFFRNKGASLIGRIWCGGRFLPLVLSFRHDERGIVLDAVLVTEISILFSFTRSYFHVDVERPYELIRFLQELMPQKSLGELYIAVGYNKHGKTELYRQLMLHLQDAPDQFVIAPGARGMVMLAFTLPSYDAVFKIIKDKFDDPKSTTRDEVMAKYYLVFKHDRAGRLVDAQEFEHLEFDRTLFSDALLSEMKSCSANAVQVTSDRVVINHLYLERRLRPLNLFVQQAPAEAIKAAVIDYGQAIKDLAAANIFPGDILLKNFGVTRHGRVVSYDYDELCLVTECNFVTAPEPRDDVEEMSPEPWYYVGENDVFPAELETWLGLDEPWRSVFLTHHSDLYQVRFWREIQDRLRAGEVLDILPYPEAKRLKYRGSRMGTPAAHTALSSAG